VKQEELLAYMDRQEFAKFEVGHSFLPSFHFIYISNCHLEVKANLPSESIDAEEEEYLLLKRLYSAGYLPTFKSTYFWCVGAV
jgi:hypothetical protein